MNINDYLLKDKEQIDDCLQNKVSVFISELTLDQLDIITGRDHKEFLSSKYSIMRKDLQYIDLYAQSNPQNLGDLEGIFSLHKWCVVGSDICRNGMLAPLQMQLYNAPNIYNPHPGSDRYSLLRPMGIQNIYVQWQAVDYVDLPEGVDYKRLNTLEDLQFYYKDWKNSLVFCVPYKLSDNPNNHSAFMKTFMKGVSKFYRYADNQDIGNKEYLRFEIKNSKQLFRDIVDTMDQFLDQLIITNNSVSAGPWYWTQEEIKFDETKIW